MILDVIIRDLSLSLRAGSGEMEITDVADDSRRVTPGCLFVARQTKGDRWRDYTAQAIERGAVAVVAPAPGSFEVPDGVALCVAPNVDQSLAGQIASIFFGHPANQLQLLGVTGTNGKTTVATLIQHLLNAAPGSTSGSSDTKCGFIGTTAIDTGHPDGPQPAELTTPGAIELQRLFAQMVAHGCTACAMEVSSHALDQGRVDGLNFAAAVFTNLTQDHLDYHGTMGHYLEAKLKLFEQLRGGVGSDYFTHGVAVVNGEDERAEQVGAVCPGRIRWTTLNLKVKPRWQVSAAEVVITTATFSRVRMIGDWGDFDVTLPVVGRHNVSNVLQAFVAADTIRPIKGEASVLLESLPLVPGRLEPVTLQGIEVPAVLVDYAHTPDALVNVLTALRPLTAGRLLCVFGCGGDRDRAKRPLMAHAAASQADVAILTSDNPRTEDPQRILDDAMENLDPALVGRVAQEIDRAKAIRAAIAEALPGDTVLIAGKGHEDYQILGTEKVHFDDREHAVAALRAWVQRQDGGVSGGGGKA